MLPSESNVAVVKWDLCDGNNKNKNMVAEWEN